MKKYTIGWALMWVKHWLEEGVFNTLHFFGFTPVTTIEKLSARSENQQAARRLTEDESYLFDHALQSGFEILDFNGDVLACTTHDLANFVRKRYGGIERVDDANVKIMLNAMQRARDRNSIKKSEHDMIMAAVWEKYEREKQIKVAQEAVVATRGTNASARMFTLRQHVHQVTPNALKTIGHDGARRLRGDLKYSFDHEGVNVVNRHSGKMEFVGALRREEGRSEASWEFLCKKLVHLLNGEEA